MMCLHVNRSVHVACDFNFVVESEELRQSSTLQQWLYIRSSARWRWLQRATNWNWCIAWLTVTILMTLGVFKGHALIANLLRWDFSYILCTKQYFGGQSTSLIYFTIAELLFGVSYFLYVGFIFFWNSVLFDFNPLYCIAHLYYVKISTSSCVGCKMKKKQFSVLVLDYW